MPWLLFLLVAVVSPPDYVDFFGESYHRAAQRAKRDAAVWRSVAPGFGLSAAEAQAIVFPEYVRYSLLRDLLETEALRLLYVHGGSSAANFSIGSCQMKPGFAERLETEIWADSLLASRWGQLFSYAHPVGSPARRSVRLDRLQTVVWQARYACLCIAWLHRKHPELQTAPPADRVAFCAAAYNLGFDRPREDILSWQVLQKFPYGSNYPGPQVAYADLSLHFYQTISPSP